MQEWIPSAGFAIGHRGQPGGFTGPLKRRVDAKALLH
jgi:hypothetical protein